VRNSHSRNICKIFPVAEGGGLFQYPFTTSHHWSLCSSVLFTAVWYWPLCWGRNMQSTTSTQKGNFGQYVGERKFNYEETM